MHDGVPHLLLAGSKILIKVFPEQWIGRGWTYSMADHAPVFRHLDFYLWEHLNSIVCGTHTTSSACNNQYRMDMT